MAFHITGLYAGILAFIAVILAVGVIRNRARSEVSVGDGGDVQLLRTMRVFGNFTEYVPLALILILLLENSGAPGWAVHTAGGVLVFARLAHAQGLDPEKGPTPGRFVGIMATFLVLIGCGGWLIAGFFGA